MQFFSSRSLLYFRVVFLLVLSFFTVKDCDAILRSGFLVLLGQAMQLPIIHLRQDDPALAILGIVFGILAVNDLIPLLANNIEYFETIIPVRLFVFFGIAAYSYLAESVFSSNIVFVYSFFEIWFNFLIYNNLRDEKYYRLKKYVEENGTEIIEERVQVVED